MANNEDPDQTPQNAAFDLGLHCLFRPVSPYNLGNTVRCNLPLDNIELGITERRGGCKEVNYMSWGTTIPVIYIYALRRLR